jgi:hypothetical protein
MAKHHPDVPFERFADDAVCHCSSEYQARRLQAELERRFAECGLALHPDKTQIVYCKDNARRRQYPNQKFDFLGYTFRPLAEPVELIERTRIYPLGKKDSSKPMQFPDASNIPLNMLFPADGSYFQMLSRFIDGEVIEPSNVDWRGMLAGIGIIKGQPFEPDEHTKAILDSAAKTAFKMSKVLAFDVILAKPAARIYQDRQWTTPILGGYEPSGPEFNLEFLWRGGSFRDLDARINYFTNYYSISPGILSKVPGKGAAYLIGFKDSAGNFYSGDKSYRLHLPAPIPAANFWSLTLYDALTASGLDNGQPFPLLNSHDHPTAMEMWPVTAAVGNVKNTGAELIEPTGAAITGAELVPDLT